MLSFQLRRHFLSGRLSDLRIVLIAQRATKQRFRVHQADIVEGSGDSTSSDIDLSPVSSGSCQYLSGIDFYESQ